MKDTKKTSQNRHLSANILNYFAAFTETRFNFRTNINYRWSGNELTLDFGIFHDFQELILKRLKNGETKSINIKKGEYCVQLEGNLIKAHIKNKLENEFGRNFLDNCVEQEKERTSDEQTVFEGTESGLKKSTKRGNKNDEEELTRECFIEGARKYNLALRDQIEKIIIVLQDQEIAKLKENLGLNAVPGSTFNSVNYVKRHFDELQLLAKNCSSVENYFDEVQKYFDKKVEDITLFDLFLNLQNHGGRHATGTFYLFFHELKRKTEARKSDKSENKIKDTELFESYPLYFIEIDINLKSDSVILSFPRDLVLINTPAVNYFKFDSILTTPRSSTLEKLKLHLGKLEVFIQSKYGISTPFVLESRFKTISAKEKQHPDIHCRIGIQVILNEDKKLLDYSELLTHLESGKDSKFIDFIGDYIGGRVDNTQDEIDKEYRDKYPIKSTSRYISDNPLNLNSSQKKILLALNKARNKIIVVDGPPGTGKSHAIAAISYWANQREKSLVITSHKQEAIDVIDRMLTDKFKDLHPQAKPSIVRIAKDIQSLNKLDNTLQNAVINAAGNRSNEYNQDATNKDKEKQQKVLVDKIEKQLSKSDTYEENVKNLFNFEQLHSKVLKWDDIKKEDLEITKIPKAINIDFNEIGKLFSYSEATYLRGLNLDGLNFLLKNRDDIPQFLEACEKINENGEDELLEIVTIEEIPSEFINIERELYEMFDHKLLIAELKPEDVKNSLLKKLFGKHPDRKVLEDTIKEIKGLKFAHVIDEITNIKKLNKDNISIQDIHDGLSQLKRLVPLKKYKETIEEYKEATNNSAASMKDIYQNLSKVSNLLDKITPELFDSINTSFKYYDSLLSKLKIEKEDLGTLAKLNNLTEQEQAVYEWIRAHYELSKFTSTEGMTSEDLEAYYSIQQKEVENINDKRLKNLNNHLGEVAKIKVSFDGGKRLSREQAEILLKNVACTIAEPSMISKYFPMNEDLIDLLVIDEASQVSIADSISLILRAKQVIIFGDEYQYGAVSATNVSAKYSKSYFREIVDAYKNDYNVSITDQMADEVIDEVGKEVSEDEEEVTQAIRPQDNQGEILWLKTFNIRTSTLSFAKAIANFTTSLTEHYRSFPEIISYSNEFFYKPAQMELTVNRIRTKPIAETLRFIKVDTQGNSGTNVNFDEIDVIIDDIKKILENGFAGTIGIIVSFREQQAKMEQEFQKRMNMPELKKKHKLAIWFVGDVQGEERDIVYYSLVEDKKYSNADLGTIYPVLGGTADSIRSLKMQRLNVGFSRAKDTIVVVHSMPIQEYSRTRLGDALKHYEKVLQENIDNDFFIEDTAIFDSPAEKDLYAMLLETNFVDSNRKYIKIVPQFKIGEYIKAEYAKQLPKYRVDFLMTYSKGGKEQSLILEYDGVEYHTKNPDIVTAHNFSQEYLDYDISRQIELESYGYRFLRINKFTLRPEEKGQTKIDMLNKFLEKSFTL